MTRAGLQAAAEAETTEGGATATHDIQCSSRAYIAIGGICIYAASRPRPRCGVHSEAVGERRQPRRLGAALLRPELLRVLGFGFRV